MFIEDSARMASAIPLLPEPLALVRNTSEANNIINGGLSLGRGDEVLLWDQNHPTNNVAWDVRASRFEGARKLEPFGQRDDAALAALGVTAGIHDTIGPGRIEKRTEALSQRLKQGMQVRSAAGSTPSSALPVLPPVACVYVLPSPTRWSMWIGPSRDCVNLGSADQYAVNSAGTHLRPDRRAFRRSPATAGRVRGSLRETPSPESSPPSGRPLRCAGWHRRTACRGAGWCAGPCSRRPG